MAEDNKKNTATAPAEETKGKEGKEKIEYVTHQNIWRAFSWFQGELEVLEKDGHVYFKKKNSDEMVDFWYTTLGKTMDFLYPILAKHGLSVRHEITDKSIEAILNHETTKEELMTVKSHTVIVPKNTVGGHTEAGSDKNITEEKDIIISGEIRSGKLPLDLTKPDMKDVGAQITYGRRYTLGLVLGIATEEDKDTEILEQGRKNVENFAFKQAKSTIEKVEVGEELEKQIEFLKKELELAEQLEAGKGTKAPSLGLKAEQYKTLLKTAEEKRDGVGEESQDNEAGGAGGYQGEGGGSNGAKK